MIFWLPWRCFWSKKKFCWCYTQDGPDYNHFGYAQDSNLTNPKPNPLTLTVILVNLIRTNQTHQPRKSPICFQKYIVISVGRLLIYIVLRIAKTDRSCGTVLRITSAKSIYVVIVFVQSWANKYWLIDWYPYALPGFLTPTSRYHSPGLRLFSFTACNSWTGRGVALFTPALRPQE